MTVCAFCEYNEAQYHRALAEVLELRLQVADGPRARVKELEANLCRANETIAERNATITSLREKAPK